ncbi:hypothetical protein SPBRAN_393 [uncultured Candidatus Thioglobus sp.]|nr:hypothetical protein SPBRAN_393 [uncultured Candidatus Thioglobus sp.]
MNQQHSLRLLHKSLIIKKESHPNDNFRHIRAPLGNSKLPKYNLKT